MPLGSESPRASPRLCQCIRDVRLLVLLCLAVLGAQPVSASNPNAMFERAEEAVRQARQRVPTCVATSEGAALKIRYRGEMDRRLLECVARYIEAPRVTLEVTAVKAGDVGFSIAAAQLLHERGWSLHVVGLCAADCANYLVPAAQTVSVAAYSAIVLGTAPTQRGLPAAIERTRTRLLSQLKGPSRELERTIERSVEKLRLQVEMQQALNIHDGWYTGSESQALVVATSGMLHSCTKAKAGAEFWYPTTAHDWRALSMLHPKIRPTRGRPGPVTCD